MKASQARIEKGMYWDRAWSLVEGCTKVSEGCTHCWSESQAALRHNNPAVAYRYKGVVDSGRWTGKINLMWQDLEKPLKVKKPQVWCIWNDLFHEDVPFEWIDEVFAVMSIAHWHRFLLLTKRPERMRQYITGRIAYEGRRNRGETARKGYSRSVCYESEGCVCDLPSADMASYMKWPLPNVMLGVTCENQARADERIPILLQIPAAVRFVSIEPCLGPIDLLKYLPKSKEVSNGQGAFIPGADRPRLVLGGRSGKNMEACTLNRGDCDNCQVAEISRTSREEYACKGELSESNVHSSRDPLCCTGSSNCVDGSQRESNPSEYGNKSHRRDQNQYAPEQSGIGYEVTEYNSCNTCDRSKASLPVGKQKPIGKAIGRTGYRDTQAVGFSGNEPKGDRGEVQHRPADCSLHSSSEKLDTPSLDWCIAGGESGRGARPMHPDWARSLRDQCQATGTKFLFKSWGEWIGGEFDRRKGKMVCDSSTSHEQIGRIFWTNPGAPKVHFWGEADHYWTHASARVGKKAAGRELDGQVWEQYPEAKP